MNERERANLHKEAEYAAEIVKTTSALPCVVPSNNIVYAFLTYVAYHVFFFCILVGLVHTR